MKRCYRPRARYDAWSAAKRLGEALLAPSLGRDGLFLAPTSGYGLNSRNGLKAGKGLRPRQFAEVLRSSIFTICTIHVCRIHQNLRSTGIGKHTATALCACIRRAAIFCGIQSTLPDTCHLRLEQARRYNCCNATKGGRYLDALQHNISIWWQNFEAISANRTRDILWSLQANSQGAEPWAKVILHHMKALRVSF